MKSFPSSSSFSIVENIHSTVCMTQGDKNMLVSFKSPIGNLPDSMLTFKHFQKNIFSSGLEICPTSEWSLKSWVNGHNSTKTSTRFCPSVFSIRSVMILKLMTNFASPSQSIDLMLILLSTSKQDCHFPVRLLFHSIQIYSLLHFLMNFRHYFLNSTQELIYIVS